MVEANSNDEAMMNLRIMMTLETVQQHFAEKHQGQSIPTSDQLSSIFEQGQLVESPEGIDGTGPGVNDSGAVNPNLPKM